MSQQPTDDNPVGRAEPVIKALRSIERAFGVCRDTLAAFAAMGFDVTTGINFRSRARAVKRDTCWAARLVMACLTEILVRFSLLSALEKCGMTMLCKPSPGSIVDMLLKAEDKLYPVLMQQRMEPDRPFKIQPQSVRLNSLVLLLARGKGLYVTSGSQLLEVVGATASRVYISELSVDCLCRTATDAAEQIKILVKSGKVTPLPPVDSSSLLPHIDLVPPHMRKGAEAVEMAQLLLGPLLAYMDAPSRPIGLEGLPQGLCFRQPSQAALPRSFLHIAINQRSTTNELTYDSSSAVRQYGSLIDLLQRSFQAHEAADAPNSAPIAVSSGLVLPPAAVQSLTQQQRKALVQGLEWVQGELSPRPPGVVGLLQYAALTLIKLQRTRRLLEKALLGMARLEASRSSSSSSIEPAIGHAVAAAAAAAKAAAAPAAGNTAGDGAPTKHKRVRWGLDTDTELLDVLLQGVMDGKSGLDLWEYTAETMFGDVTRAMALQQRLVKLTTALHWFDFEQSKAPYCPLPGAQPKREVVTAAAVRATAEELLGDATSAGPSKLLQVRQVLNGKVRKASASLELGPSGSSMANWIKVSGSSTGMIVGASSQAGGNAITAGLPDTLGHSPLLAFANVEKAGVELCNSLLLQHKGGMLYGSGGVRGDPFRGNHTLKPGLPSSLEISAATTYPGLAAASAAAAPPPPSSSGGGGSSSGGSGDGSSSSSSSSSSCGGGEGADGDSNTRLPPAAVAILRSVADRLQSDSPQLRQEAQQELECLCGGKERLQLLINELICVAQPGPVQLLLSCALRAYDMVHAQCMMLSMAAAGMNVFGAGVRTGLMINGKQCFDSWLKMQSALLSTAGGGSGQQGAGNQPGQQGAPQQAASLQASQLPAASAPQQQQQQLLLPQGACAAINGGAGAALLQQAFADLRASAICSPLSMLNRIWNLRDGMKRKYALQLPGGMGAHFRGLGPDSGIQLMPTEEWTACFPGASPGTVGYRFLILSCTQDSAAEARLVRNAVLAAVWPDVQLSSEGYPFPEQHLLDIGCWLQLARDNSVVGAAFAYRELQRCNPQLLQRVQQLRPKMLEHRALVARWRHQLRPPQPQRPGSLQLPPSWVPPAANRRTPAAGAGAAAGISSSPPVGSGPPAQPPSLAGVRAPRRGSVKAARFQEMAGVVLRQLKAAGMAPLGPMLMNYYDNNPQLCRLEPLARLLPATVVFLKGTVTGKKRGKAPHASWLALTEGHARTFRSRNEFVCSMEPQPFVQATAPYAGARKRKGSSPELLQQQQDAGQQQEQEQHVQAAPANTATAAAAAAALQTAMEQLTAWKQQLQQGLSQGLTMPAATAAADAQLDWEPAIVAAVEAGVSPAHLLKTLCESEPAGPQVGANGQLLQARAKGSRLVWLPCGQQHSQSHGVVLEAEAGSGQGTSRLAASPEASHHAADGSCGAAGPTGPQEDVQQQEELEQHAAGRAPKRRRLSRAGGQPQRGQQQSEVSGSKGAASYGCVAMDVDEL